MKFATGEFERGFTTMFRSSVFASVAVLSFGVFAQTPPPPPPPPVQQDVLDRGELDNGKGDKKEGSAPEEKPPEFKDHWYLLGTGFGQLHDSLGANGAAAFSLGLMKAVANDQGGELLEYVFAVSRGASNDPYTSQSDMAKFVLSPELSPFAAAFRIDYWNRAKYKAKLDWGSYFAVGLGLSRWQTGTGSAAVTNSVLTVALHAGLSAFIWGSSGDNSVRVIVHGGLTNRTIAGDVFAQNDFLRSTIGSPQNDYFGAETGFDIQLQDVTVGVQFPLLVGNVPGLTHGQLLPFASVGGRFDLGGGDSHATQPKTDKPKADSAK